jgi:formylglycine-generating enzyme required for sulfatase activity|tara:strand:- start:1810 stop:2826 length:1017 start_codon:yes stop_codon:yes gene_type:complete
MYDGIDETKLNNEEKEELRQVYEEWQFIQAFWGILFIGLIVLIVYFFNYLSSFFGLAPYLAGIFLMGLNYYINNLFKEYREQRKVCPFCAEKIKKIAVVCKHCGKEVVATIKKQDLVFVSGGKYEMGSESGEEDEKPLHSVTVSDFYIAKTNVTFEQYHSFCDTTNRERPPDIGWGENCAVIDLSWHDAIAYCEWMSKRTGKTVRLPTEAEWEYAARGGNMSKGYKYSGSNDPNSVAWHNTFDLKGYPVEQKEPNELGIYGMTGNVWEWCSDWYHEKYYKSSPHTDPKGPKSGKWRVLRGGVWSNDDDSDFMCPSTGRYSSHPEDVRGRHSFRYVQEK